MSTTIFYILSSKEYFMTGNWYRNVVSTDISSMSGNNKKNRILFDFYKTDNTFVKRY